MNLDLDVFSFLLVYISYSFIGAATFVVETRPTKIQTWSLIPFWQPECLLDCVRAAFGGYYNEVDSLVEESQVKIWRYDKYVAVYTLRWQ